MQTVLLPLIVAFFSSMLAIKVLMPLAPKVGLVDIPNERKKHRGSIPLIGGLSIFTGVLIASTLFAPYSQVLNLYLISSAMLVFVGMLDDIYDLSVRFRIAFQGLVAAIMVFGANIFISELGDVFAIGAIDLENYGMIFTVVAVMAAINAFNMVDGIDGLAGSLSIVAIASIALMNSFAGDTDGMMLSLILVVAILPFMFYNVSDRNARGKKIFMGDAGSMFMGLTVVWLLTLGSQGNEKAFNPVTALWFIAVPLMDMIAIMFRRMKKGISPFKADNGHLHHIFIRAGLSSRQTLFSITSVAIALSLIGVAFEMSGLPEWLSLLTYLIVFAGFIFLLSHSWQLTKFIRKCLHIES